MLLSLHLQPSRYGRKIAMRLTIEVFCSADSFCVNLDPITKGYLPIVYNLLIIIIVMIPACERPLLAFFTSARHHTLRFLLYIVGPTSWRSSHTTLTCTRSPLQDFTFPTVIILTTSVTLDLPTVTSACYRFELCR